MSSVFESVFRSQPEEYAFAVTRVTGEVPKELSGTFLRTGPGRMELGADLLNFFDGHAQIAGVSFAGGAATFRSRFVRTPLLDEEVRKQAVVQRRAFTNHPKRWKNFAAPTFGNSVMHDVYAWGEGDALRVVAANDPGHVGLDPKTLETVGPVRWGLPDGEEMGPMPYRDPLTGRLVAWTKKLGGVRPDKVRFVELDGSFQIVAATPYHALSGAPAIVHDQRATVGWYVAVEQAPRLSPLKALWGATTIWNSLVTPPGGTAAVVLVPRQGDGPLVRVPMPAPYEIAFHVINAYDEGDHVVVDVCAYGGPVPFDTAAPRALRERLGVEITHTTEAVPLRLVIDPKTARCVETKSLGAGPLDAPEVADAFMGRPYRYVYGSTLSGEDVPNRGFFAYYGSVGKLDVTTGEWRTWRAGGATVSPCAFVARAGGTEEDDGWVLTWLLREQGASVAILDARAVEKGPVATLDLGVHLPGVNHTRWAAGLRLEA